MAKRKKRQEDFQKVKLKVGRKLKKENETRTDFKVRKIVLKEAARNDPLKTLLNNNVPATTQLKLVYLKKLSEGRLSVTLKDITGEVISGLSKFFMDNDSRVRAETVKCLKQCITNLTRRCQVLSPFLSIMLNYVKCGLTHIDSSIMMDCRTFLRYLIDQMDVESFPLLMDVTSARLSLQSLDCEDHELALKVVQRILGLVKVEEFQAPTITWSPDNSHCDLSFHFIKHPGNHFNITFPDCIQNDVEQNFIRTLENIVEKEFRALYNRNTWNFTEDEARKLVAAYGIGKVINYIPKSKKKFEGAEASIVTSGPLKDKSRLKQHNNLKQQLDAIITLL